MCSSDLCSRQQKQLVAAFPSDSRMLTPAKATCRRFSIGFPDAHASKSDLSPLFPRIPGCLRQQKRLVAAFPSNSRMLTPAKATCRRFSLEFPDAHASKSKLSPLFPRIPGCSRQQKQLVAAFPSDPRMLTPAKAPCRRFSLGFPDFHASKSGDKSPHSKYRLDHRFKSNRRHARLLKMLIARGKAYPCRLPLK